ncbi:MAG: Ig-like domain-containing protein, partial [Pseudomonadota bacterium]
EVDEDGSIQFDAFENDIGTGLTLTTVSNPGNGTVDFPSPSSALFTYTPNADFAGQDSFIYTVRDEQGREATATVNITVRDDDISGSAADAQQITTGQLFASELDGDFDADYFSLDLSTTNGTVFALTLGGDAAGEAELFIRPAGGQAIVESGADGQIIYAPDNDATTLDFVVATNTSVPNDPAVDDYTIIVNETLPDPDLPAAENTPLHVNLSGDGVWSTNDSAVSYLATIDEGSDTDWIGLWLDVGQTVRLQLSDTGDDPFDADLRIRNEFGDIVTQSFAAGDEDFTFSAVSGSGQYYLEVFVLGSPLATMGTYELTVTDIV